MAYLTLFPIGNTMRANLMVYRPMDDIWFREFRKKPEATMRAMMPGLDRMAGDFKVVGPVKIRPADLYVTENHRQAGVVLIGDAFATSCPAAGTGTDKVFTDVERLCNVHIPHWLATEGMEPREDRAVLRRSGQDGVRCMVDRESLASSFAVDRQWPDMARTPLGALHRRLAPGLDAIKTQVLARSIRHRNTAGIARRRAGVKC